MSRPDHAADIAQMVADMLVLSPGKAAEFERALRIRFGGETLRISERAPVTPEHIDARLRAGVPVREIAVETGIHRSTVYRLLSRDGLKSRGKPAKCDNTGG